MFLGCGSKRLANKEPFGIRSLWLLLNTKQSSSGGPMKIILAKPRGFCAGVERAIKCVEEALERYGRPVYVLNDIVHNAHVVNRLRERGAVFVKDITEVPAGAHLLFSAH